MPGPTRQSVVVAWYFAGDQHGPNDTLDPALYTSAVDYFRGRMFYGSLTRLTKELGYEPELAEEVLSNDSATDCDHLPYEEHPWEVEAYAYETILTDIYWR